MSTVESSDHSVDDLSVDEESAGTVRVRLWAGARAAAGTDTVDLPVHHGSCTVGEVLADLHGQLPALAPVTAVSTLLVDGVVVTARDRLRPGDVLEVLPPFAGG